VSQTDIQALGLTFLGAYARLQGRIDNLAHYFLEREGLPTASLYLQSRLRLNDEDRWALVETIAADVGARAPDSANFRQLKRTRDFLAHQQVSIGDRDGVEVLFASKSTTSGRLEQWSAAEEDLRAWIADANSLAQAIHQLGDGVLYTIVTSSRSTSWNVLATEEKATLVAHHR